MPSIIHCQNAYKIYDKNIEGKSLTALSDISFELEEGRILGLLGPDGSGKTSLIHLVTGMKKANLGKVITLGYDMAKHANKIQQDLGYMPQIFGLYEDLSIEENMDLYARLHSVPLKERKQRYEKLYAMSSLEPFTKRLAGQLSGGMKQKLSLCCSLIASPRLLVLDEPTVGVDPRSRRELWKIIQNLVDTDKLSVFVSSSYMDEALYCDRTMILYRGHLLANDPPETVIKQAQGITYELQCPPNLTARQLQSKLVTRPSVINATPYGNLVRIVIPSDSADFQEIKNYQISPCEPDFSDGFMTILMKHLKKIGEKTEAQDLLSASRTNENTLSARPRTELPITVEAYDLTKQFGKFTAVDHVSFKVHKGEIFGLLGPNGAGKSTSFRMLCGLLNKDGGNINIDGQDLRSSNSSAREKLGYVAQKFSQYGNLSVRENLRFSAAAYGLSGLEQIKRIQELTEEFELSEYLQEPAKKLPGGYKQRLSLACALLHNPSILFLDEVTSGADPFARRDFWLRINRLAEQGVSVIITTHFLNEAEFCDYILIMMDGKCLAQGTPAEIRSFAPQSSGKTASLEDAFLSITSKTPTSTGGDK